MMKYYTDDDDILQTVVNDCSKLLQTKYDNDDR